MRRALMLFVMLAVLSGCQAGTFIKKTIAPVEGEGEVYLYARPFPQTAARLKFTIAEVSAVREDGSETPLDVSISDIDGQSMTYQRRLATGRLEPGLYTGFSFKVSKATLTTEEGVADLLVPKEPVKTAAAFEVRSGKAAVYFLAFDYASSVNNNFGFSPVFAASVPEKPITKLVGYVSNKDSYDLTVLDKRARQVAGVIPSGREPGGMAFDQARARAYVALTGDDEVEVMDVSSGSELSRIRLDVGDNPKELALTPDGSQIITVNNGSNSVSFADAGSLTVTKKVGVGEGPVSVLLDRTGRLAYVFNYDKNSISILDLTTKTLAGTIGVEAGPVRGQFNRAGDRLYVIYGGSPYMTVYAVPRYTVINRVYVGMGALSLKVDAHTDLIYVSKAGEDRLYVYDPFSFIPIDYIETPGAASYMAIDDEGDNLFLTVPDSGAVACVSLGARKTLAVFDAGYAPNYISLMGERY